jgi:hypothetical protein
VRQNRRVTADRRRWSLVIGVMLAIVLSGCGERERPAGTDRGTPRFDGATMELAWQGVLACADCGGIDMRLHLYRGNGAAAKYELVEAFLVGDGAEYFHEEGRWRRDGRILRLQASAGGERLYAIDPDGNLIVIDRQGRIADDAHVLSPVDAAPNL